MHHLSKWVDMREQISYRPKRGQSALTSSYMDFHSSCPSVCKATSGVGVIGGTTNGRIPKKDILTQCCLGKVYVFEKYALGIVYSFKKNIYPCLQVAISSPTIKPVQWWVLAGHKVVGSGEGLGYKPIWEGVSKGKKDGRPPAGRRRVGHSGAV
jgi:hypothetical protein